MAPRSLALIQPRGGVGKSTAVAQLAASLAATRPDLIVNVIDASIHGDASALLLGGLQEPKNSPTARSHAEELCTNHIAANKSTAALFTAFAGGAGAANPTVTRATGWGRLLGGGSASTAQSAVTLTHAAISNYIVKVCDVYPSGGAPPNLFLAIGGGGLKDMSNDEAVRASQALATAISGAPNNHVYLFDTDAEINERPASACAAATASGVALLSTANWSDFLRSLTDPVNGVTIALAPPFPPKKIERVIFTRVAKTRNEQTPVAGASVSPFKPVNAALANVEQIVQYIFDRAQPGGPMSSYVDANVPLRQFADDHVIVIPDLPENVISTSILQGVSVACMEAGGGVTADALGAAQQQLAFAAARLV